MFENLLKLCDQMARKSASRQRWPRYQDTNLCTCSCQKSLLLFLRVGLGARPAAEDKGDLVDEIGNVVDNIQDVVIHCTGQEAEEVTQRVNAPTKADNDTHVVERGLHGLRATVRASVGLTSKDLVEDEAPASQTADKANPCVEQT